MKKTITSNAFYDSFLSKCFCYYSKFSQAYTGLPTLKWNANYFDVATKLFLIVLKIILKIFNFKVNSGALRKHSSYQGKKTDIPVKLNNHRIGVAKALNFIIIIRFIFVKMKQKSLFLVWI